MQLNVPEWMQWLQALGPTISSVVIGSIAAYVAWRQWRTAQDKIQLDLFDRRFALFLDVFRDYRWMSDKPEFANARVDILVRAQVLFGKETLELLQKMFTTRDLLNQPEPDNHKRQAAADAQATLSKRVGDLMVHQLELPKRTGDPKPSLLT